MKKKPVIFLQGKRLYLRAIEKGDLANCQRWINDPELRIFLLRQTPVDEIAEASWHGNRCRDTFPSDITFAIVLKKNHRYIGNAGIHRIDWLSRHATTGALIGEKDCHNKGYGSEAKALILEYCFETLGMHRICSDVLETNPRSLAYLKKSGYREEGRLREHVFHQGRWIDQIQLGILASEWHRARSI